MRRPLDRTLNSPSPSGNRRWLALAFIALAQLMVALDATIVNIALPSAQAALGFSDAERQWVITAYTLAFGGLLLLGGRIADGIGRKRALLIGLVGFACASAASGAAPNLALLTGARALQGAFAALLAPTALSLLAVTFTEPKDRARAFAVYGAIAGSGGAIGLVLGGVLAEYLDWRWCLYVNVPIAIVAALGAAQLLSNQQSRRMPRLDVPGAVLATAGLVALVEACSQAVQVVQGQGQGQQGWTSPIVIALFAVGLVALGAFATWEARTPNPILPLRILLDRNRAGAYLSVICAIIGMFGTFLLLTYELQVVLHYSPLQAGLAFLPLSGAAMFGSGAIASRLLPRVSPRTLMVPGFLIAAVGMLLLSQLQVSVDYLRIILPAELLLGLGIGCVMVPATSTATSGVDPADAGIASATLNTAQQVGASFGTALLNTIAITATAAAMSATAAVGSAANAATTTTVGAATATTVGAAATAASAAADRLSAPGAALVHGYATAALAGAAVLLLGAVAAGLLVTVAAPTSSRPPTSQHQTGASASDAVRSA